MAIKCDQKETGKSQGKEKKKLKKLMSKFTHELWHDEKGGSSVLLQKLPSFLQIIRFRVTSLYSRVMYRFTTTYYQSLLTFFSNAFFPIKLSQVGI